MNALWDGEVIALLDFEFAVLGPVEIDLCRLVCEARVAEEGQHVESEAGAAAVEIAARHMDPKYGRGLAPVPPAHGPPRHSVRLSRAPVPVTGSSRLHEGAIVKSQMDAHPPSPSRKHSH